ncbi:hypothetical protein PBY51_005071 [Eleginops maclovinus]|uniref:Secreted protein n=1 Tax=Eleginops maclovinus TaxID=56733 RepID=A0AAN8AA00_ELEMC|nr:hypothetical protein PBY51_005071 [Eleginops maclovinus]
MLLICILKISCTCCICRVLAVSLDFTSSHTTNTCGREKYGGIYAYTIQSALWMLLIGKPPEPMSDKRESPSANRGSLRALHV